MRRKGLTIIALCIALSISGCAKGSNKEDSINKKTEETKESGKKASNGTQDKENPYEGIKLKADEDVVYKFSNVSVHDPSVVRADGNYYIFGSHLTAAKSTNLIDWTLIDTGVTATNSIIPDAKKEMPEAFEWAKTDTFWAPDVIQLADGRYYMYYCTCEGSMPLSTLGIAVADNIEGPYEDLGIILKSGMGEDIPSEDGDVYNAGVQPNVVDPCVYYDTEGRLWMMYGSYSGGIFVLELDPKTGFPLEKGYGKKILGANHLRIEGSYVLYNEETKYYYMFLSYGGLAADGGYNIRVARSENPDGPFYDTEGNDMIDCKGPEGSFFDDSAAMKYGAKLMGNYRFAWVEGENGKIRQGLISPGHNSAIYDEETGKYYIIFHTRFEGRGEEHEVRVHQLFFNEKGWPVIAPYRYIGESIGAYEKKEIVGTYKFLNHMHDISADVKVSDEIILNEDGSISGKFKGTWELVGENEAKLTVNNIEYTGVFLKQWDEYGLKYVMTFTALSDKGYAIWGSGLEALDSLD